MDDPKPLVGEPLALDLVNTRQRTASGSVDLIATTAALKSWLCLEEELHPDLARAGTADDLTAGDIAAVHAVRDHAAVAIAHVRNRNAPPAGVLRALNEAMAAAPPIRELAWAHGTIVAAAARRGSAGERVWRGSLRPPPTFLPIRRSATSANARARTASCCSCPGTRAASGARPLAAEIAPAWPATTATTSRNVIDHATAGCTSLAATHVSRLAPRSGRHAEFGGSAERGLPGPQLLKARR